jgi:hypothetical protein
VRNSLLLAGCGPPLNRKEKEMADSGLERAARLSAVSAALVTSGLAAGCDRKLEEPVLRYEVRMEADAKSADACDAKGAIRFEPVKIAPQARDNLYQMTAFSNLADMVGKPMLDGPDNYECWYTYQSPALSPGKWLVTGEFSSGSQSCLLEVAPGLPARIRIDQEDGCVEVDQPVPASGPAMPSL